MAACILLGLLLKHLPLGIKRPRWISSFVKEPILHHGEDAFKKPRPMSSLSYGLLIVSVIGLALQTTIAFTPHFRPYLLLPAASWATACLLTAVCRPYSAPKSLLVVYCSILVSQSIISMESVSSIRGNQLLTILVPIVALAAIGIIINMPLRRKDLPNDQISPVYGPPTATLRSPEDNFTLWQFMTVSWMSPLISLGNTRQLDDDNVWSLSYEFQHRPLHDQFREFRGSVLRRLLKATGADLLLITLLSLVELFASMYLTVLMMPPLTSEIDYSAPLLLQKILQSMENPNAPLRAALTYTVLALLVRLIASQSAVFNLWYGRRAYERSRGAMITMLYEKTLSRKVVSISTNPREAESLEAEVDGPRSNGNSKPDDTTWWNRSSRLLKQPFRASKKRNVKEEDSDKPKDLATMGKIINLMR